MTRKYFAGTLLLFVFILCASLNSRAQLDLEVIPCTTAEEVIALVDTVFLKGVNPASIANITFSGDPTSVGYFRNGSFTGFKKPEGIVMTSGLSDDVDKSNVCGTNQNASTNNNGINDDSDLELLSGQNSYDGCIIEFDFKPTSDTVRFNYVFASEEYHDFVDDYNDMFGFFLSGPNISGPYLDDAENIALIPGTNTGVAIKTINIGDNNGVTCIVSPIGCTNCQFFTDNSNTTDSAFNQFVYDGYTTALTAKAAMEMCEWHHIKLAISDGGDSRYDSGVLLEAGSFNAGNVSAIAEYSHPTVDSLLYESCNNHEAVLYFEIEEPMSFPFIVPFEIGGTAVRNVDYQLLTTQPGDTILIEPGETYDSIIIRPFYDIYVEGEEDIQVIFNPAMCNLYAVPDTVRIIIDDLPEMKDTTLNYLVYCEETALLSFESVINGVRPFTYNWYSLSPPQSTPEVDFTPSGDDYFVVPVVISDTCGQQISDTAFVIVPDPVADAGPDQSLCNLPYVQLEGSSAGAQFFWWISDPPDATLIGQEDQPDPVVSPTTVTMYQLEVSDNCTHIDFDTTYVFLDEASADAGINQSMCMNDSVTLSCNAGESYYWTAIPTDPGLAGQQDQQSIRVSPASTTIYTVEVTNDCGFSADDDVEVTVYALPNASAGSDGEICFHQSFNLQASGGTSYFWTSNPVDPSLVGQDTLANPTVTPDIQTNYTYTVTITNENGCAQKDSMVLEVQPVPVLSVATDNNIICYGEPVTITITGNADYNWTADPPDPTLFGQEHNQVISVIPLETTTYTLDAVVSGFDCHAEESITITVTPELLSSFVMQDNEVCQGSSFGVNYNGNASPTATYTWDFDGAIVFTGSGSGPYDISWDEAGDKTITLTVIQGGCSSSESVNTLTVTQSPHASFEADPTEACAPFDVNFTNTSTNESNEVTYSWDFGNAETSTLESPSVTYNDVGVFNVALSVTNDQKCSNTSTITELIKANETPTSQFVTDAEVCQGSAFEVNYIGNASPAATYNWDFDGATINSGSGQGPYTISWNVAGNKNITLTVIQDGCPSTESGNTLAVVQSPIASYEANPTEACLPFNVDFTNTSTNQSSQVTYAWDFGNGETSLLESPSVTFDNAGTYNISLTVTNDQKCSSISSIANFIKANETPSAQFVAEPPEATLEDATIDFTNNSLSSETLVYNWDFADGNSSSDENPSHTYMATGIYLVNLLVTSPYGCDSETSHEVTIFNYPNSAVYAPSAFTPNGDGKNDLFEVKGIGIQKYNLQVYSRWGELVYESNSLEDQWNGKYKGTLVPSGTLAYTISYTNALGADFKLQGTVTVLY